MAQLRGTITRRLTAPQAGLVAVWSLGDDTSDPIGGHHGALGGAGVIQHYPPGAFACTGSSTVVCFANRFQVQVTWWVTGSGATGIASIVPGFSTDSANFWFFAASNWELLVKTVNGCGLNDRHWLFYAPVTDVHYKIFVIDTVTGKAQSFLGYQGLTQGATDTNALDTCP